MPAPVLKPDQNVKQVKTNYSMEQKLKFIRAGVKNKSGIDTHALLEQYKGKA